MTKPRGKTRKSDKPISARSWRILQGAFNAMFPSRVPNDGKPFTVAELLTEYKRLYSELRRKGRSPEWTFRRTHLNSATRAFRLRVPTGPNNSWSNRLDAHECQQLAEAQRTNRQITAFLREQKKGRE